MSLTRIPLDGILTECVVDALKSRSTTVDPPLPSVTVSLGVPAAVFNCIWRIRAGPTPTEPVAVMRFDFTSESAIVISLRYCCAIVTNNNPTCCTVNKNYTITNVIKCDSSTTSKSCWS